MGNKLGYILGYNKDHIQLRGGVWHYVRRVPKDYAHLDKRRFAKQSLKTDSEAVAIKRAVVVNDATEQFWRDLLTHGDSGAKERYAAAIRLARSLGFTYKPVDELAKDNLIEIANRFDAVIARGPDRIPEAVHDAILGTVDKPPLSLSNALEEFWELSQHEIRTKTENELRRWKNPRKKAVNAFIEVVGDKLLSEITRTDALNFRSWWMDRIEEHSLTANAANKDIQHLSGIFSTVNDDMRLNLDNPFHGLRLSEKNDGGNRVPFAPDYVQKTLLSVERLTALNLSLESQMLIFAAADTGCGMSELTGLDPDLDEINLTAAIPYIHIKPNKHRALKVKHRDRTIPLVGAALYAFQQCPNGFPSYRGKAQSASSWINKVLRNGGLYPAQGNSLYSLRHTFQDRLTSVDIPDMIAAALMGHGYHRTRYGAGPTLDLKRQWLDKIAFKIEK